MIIFKRIVVIVFLCLNGTGILDVRAQNLEFMPGSERFFADVQWLRTIDEAKKWSVFSRTRGTVEDSNTNIFSGAYLNYTTGSGFGGTVLGRLATAGAGADAGIHFFKANSEFMIYALASIQISNGSGYSWFSITRWRPSINEKMNLYNSLELFTNFNNNGHVASVQRIRLGLDVSSYQFGLALNLTGIGNEYSGTDTNPGIFIRKEF